ncbi:hypothetical protein [Blautia massiliensis (ex Durand et al. 2017)]|uniref:hypothetical protein n=1 Tax=Blautia massiliensis (ex Durand et al. 2017) TaxID=1737424 RepID=UPI00189FCCC9|nr:hypothetical protein [Blautia massiliensis (ex Durand et al. 2017)]
MNEKSSNREKIDKNFLENSGASASTIDAYGKSLKGFRKELNKTTKDGKEASATMKDYNEYLSKNGEETIRSTSVTKDLGAGLKNIGKTALSIGGNILIDTAISYGLTKAGEAWNNYSNKQENAIEKGNEALSKYKQTNSTMQEATSWIKDNAERYTELAKGATSLGEQGSLTDSEFKEYNELSAQMATYLPSQIKGYNSLGTAILSVGDSTKQVNNALQSEKLTQYAKSANEASDVIDKFKAEMYQNAGLTKEIGLTNQQKAIENFLADYDDKDYGGHGNKIKEAFLHRGDGMTTGMYAYLNNANLIETFKKAGIKGSSWFGQQYTQNDFLNKDNINTLRNYQQQLSTEAQTSVDAIKEIMPAFLQSNKDYLKLTDNLPEMDSMISSIYSNFDKNGVESILGGNLNDLSSEEAEKGIRDWTSNLVKDLQKKDTQDALTSLFALDDKKTKMSFNEYEKQADDAVKKVRKQTDAFTDEQLRNSSGIHDTLDQLQTDVDNITSKFSGDKGFSADKLKSDYTSSQLDALSSIATDKTFTGNWKAALNQMNSVERAAQLSADKMQKIVTTATSNLSTMQTAISESMSNTGVTADTLKSLASAVSDNVEGYDFTKKNLFAESAKGIKVNKDALSQLLEVQHKAKSTDFSDAIDKQTKAIQDQNKAVEKAKNTESYDTEKAKLQDMFDDLAKIRQARSQYNALYQQQQEALTDYADWVNAQRTENAGDKYTNMVTGLKNAQELYNKGLVGEDDFKSFAKMISPTGATDVANFEENYNKAKRYLTDNDKGVKNFLNDLKSKGLATYSDSDGWNIGDIDLKRDSRAMGIGKDFMSNMFGRLEDYGFHNNVFSTTEEGVQKLSEAYKNLFDSQSRVKDLEKNDSGNATAIQGAKDDVEAYKADIEQIKNGFSNVTEDTADQYSAEIDAAHDQAEFLEKQREEVLLDKDGKYGDKAKQIASMMEADIDELKSKYEDSLDDIDVKTEKQIKKEAKDKENANKDATSDNSSTPDFGNDEQSKKTYDDVFKQIKDAKDNNDKDVQQAIDTLSNFTADQVNGVDLFDGKYDSDELKPAEQALDSLKEKFQLTDEQAQMLGKVFESMGVLKPETDTSDVDKVKDDAKEAVDDLNEITGKQYKIDFDTTDPDKIQQQLNEISSEVDKHVTTDSEGNPHYDESQEGAVEAEKAYKAEVQHQQQNEYETSAMGQYESDNNLVQAMQNFMQAKNEMDTQTQYAQKGMDNTLQTATDNATKAYESLKQAAQESGNSSIDLSDIQTAEDSILALNNKDIKEKVDVDTSQAESDIQNLQNLEGSSITINADVSTNGGVEELENSLASIPQGVSTTVTCDVEGESDVDNLESSMESIPDNTPVTIDCHVENQDQLDQINQKADQLNASGKQIKINATVGEVKTDGAASSTPIDVKGNVTSVTGTPSGTVDVKGKVTSVTGKPSGTVEVKGKLAGNISGASTKKASVTFSAKHGDVDTYKPKNKNAKVIFGKDSRIPDGYKPDDKSAKVNYTLGSTPSYNPPNIERTVTYTIRTVGSAPSGGSTTHSSSGGKMGGSSGTFASGTMTSLGHARAFASGSLTDFSPAFAKGNVSIPHDQTALVNEERINGHSESIVHNGIWSLIPGGAHLAHLKKGDMIFSASQTEALLKNGSISGHARAYASGTVDDVGDIDLSHAFAGGMHGNFAGGAAGRKLGSSNKKTNTTPTSSGGGGNSGGGNGGGGGGNNSSTTSKQKHAEQVFDWVARTLTKFKDTVENISNRINDYVSSAFKKTMLNRQEKAIVEEINANKHGAQSYTNKANSIASGYTYYYTPEGSDTEQKMNIVIPDSYKKAVQGGYWNIEDMDTTTDFGKGLAEAIQKYQDYYDKAKNCTQEAQNLYNEQLKVFEQWANMPTEDAGKKIDTLTNKVNGLKSAISSLSTGKSGLASIARQIKVDNPNITKAEQKLNSAKKTQSNAQKKLTSARKARGNAVKVATQSTIKVDSASSNLKSVLNKSNASSARKKKIRKAINSGQTINTKGLKGTTLKAAKQYNSAVKKNAKDMDRVSRTEYQVTSAQRHLSIANKNVKTQQTNLTNAKKNLTATQRAILSKQKSKKTFVAQNALLDYQTSASKQENAYRQSALKAAKKNMQTYKNNIANRDKSKKALLATKGKITTAQRNAIKKNQKVDTSNIKNPKLKKQLEAYNKYVTGSNPDKGRILSNALSTAQSNADQAQAEYAAMRVTNEQEKFKNVQNYYSGWNDRYSNYTEQHQKKYEKSEAHGNYTNSKKYDTQINDLQKQRKYKQNEVTDLQKQLNASVKSGIIKKGSEEWLEMTNQILEAQNAVSDFDTQIEQAKQDKITTVYEEMFDRAIEKANRLKDKISSINDLITEDMMIDKDTGNLTEMGALSITMNSQQLDIELNNLQTYVKKRQQIMDDFANGSSKSKYGEKTYDELMSENDSAMQESLKNANNYRQSIISIVINQAKAVQDAMFKEIDARKKALKKKKEYYDYDKTIKKKTDEIELIKQQIRGLEGLTDAESKAQKARLEASLKDKQDDLDDTVRDHVYDITVNGLDDLETQLSEDFEKWSNQLSSDLAKMSDAISNAINGAGENYSDMMAGIDYILNNIGDITSGQYFTNQDKSNMKNSNSLDTGYNSGHLKGYAKGTKHVGSNRIAMTNENGREIIVTKDGWITPLEASDMVIPNDITETLIDMAERQQNYAMNGNFKMPELKVKDASGNSVNNVYNTFTVQGDLTRDTLPELNKILDLASSKTQNDIRKNKRRFG